MKRTMILLSLTTIVAALLLAAGCGGANKPIGSVSGDQSLSNRQENTPPTAPVLVRPNNMQILYVKDGRIRFVAVARDSDGDRLKYRIVLKQNGNVIAVFDQIESSAGWSKSDYASGEYAILAVPLSAGSYQWNAQAFDGKAWGPFHNSDATFSYTPPR